MTDRPTNPARPRGVEELAAAVPMPDLEPVAHPDCRVCFAADRGRTAARTQGAPQRVADFNRVITEHPHRADQDEGAER
ncbi:hypothetical protein [Streptomyces sp. NPDC006879]|uniref:hypothetical protein n=1 Tax=Streptomyces sp. NPDC006879 TaxID=3364767 RepID=UPI0036BD14A8